MLKKTIKTSLLSSLIAAFSSSVFAESIAITNAKVYTGAELTVLENATVVFEDGKITAINPDSIAADTTIDGTGKILTPGFIGSINSLGLIEVGAVAATRDARAEKATITFDPTYAFNAESTLLPLARRGGITGDIIVPSGKSDDFTGIASYVSTASDLTNTEVKSVAVVAHIQPQSKGSRAQKLQMIEEALTKQQEKLNKPKDDDKEKSSKTPSASEEALTKLLKQELPLLVITQRPADILQALALKEKFSLKLIIAGASGAVAVSEQLADAEVPIIIPPMDNLPQSFDELHSQLDNAATLSSADVTLGLTVSGDSSHNLHQLRFAAGNAVSNGLNYETAIAAISSNIATAFSLTSKGTIEPGKDADLILWTGDPLEFSSTPANVWIGGVEQSIETRQDKLRDRYLSDSDLPRAYIQ